MMEAVIFDMDGVLIDSEPLHLRLEIQIFKELGLEIPREEHEDFMGTSNIYMFGILKERYGLIESIEALVTEERHRYQTMLASIDLPIISGIPELVRELHSRGIKIAVASSAPYEQIDLVMERSGFEAFFEQRVSGDDVQSSKPDPAIFLKAAAGLNCSPEFCWVIEDSTHGITAGNAAGMKTIGFADPSAPPQNLSAANYVVNSIPSAAKLILN